MGIEVRVRVGMEVEVVLGWPGLLYAGCNLCDLHIMLHRIMAPIFFWQLPQQQQSTP